MTSIMPFLLSAFLVLPENFAIFIPGNQIQDSSRDATSTKTRLAYAIDEAKKKNFNWTFRLINP